MRYPQPRLIRELTERGADRISHSGDSLLRHLLGTAAILRSKGFADDVCNAGLFHAVYGTERFEPTFNVPWSRAEIVELIGVVAENLVYLYSIVSLAKLLVKPREVEGGVLVGGREVNTVIRLKNSTYESLREIVRANDLEMSQRRGSKQCKTTTHSIATFFSAPLIGTPELKPGAIAMFGIPSDAGSRKRGSRYGPHLLRNATSSVCFRSKTPESIIDLENLSYLLPRGSLFDLGDVPVHEEKFSEACQAVLAFASRIPVDVVPFAVGGDHSFTYSLLSARMQYGCVDLIHIDQHSDLQVWGQFNSDGPANMSPLSHSNFVSHIVSRFPNTGVTQIGVERFLSTGPYGSSSDEANATKYLKRFSRLTDRQAECSTDEHLIKVLPRDRDVYLSIDIDVLCASCMGDTAYPGAVGISYQRLTHLVELIFRHNRVVGCDLMEFGSIDTSHKSTSARLAANLCATLASHLLAQNLQGGRAR